MELPSFKWGIYRQGQSVAWWLVSAMGLPLTTFGYLSPCVGNIEQCFMSCKPFELHFKQDFCCMQKRRAGRTIDLPLLTKSCKLMNKKIMKTIGDLDFLFLSYWSHWESSLWRTIFISLLIAPCIYSLAWAETRIYELADILDLPCEHEAMQLDRGW